MKKARRKGGKEGRKKGKIYGKRCGGNRKEKENENTEVIKRVAYLTSLTFLTYFVI